LWDEVGEGGVCTYVVGFHGSTVRSDEMKDSGDGDILCSFTSLINTSLVPFVILLSLWSLMFSCALLDRPESRLRKGRVSKDVRGKAF